MLTFFRVSSFLGFLILGASVVQLAGTLFALFPSLRIFAASLIVALFLAVGISAGIAYLRKDDATLIGLGIQTIVIVSSLIMVAVVCMS